LLRKNFFYAGADNGKMMDGINIEYVKAQCGYAKSKNIEKIVNGSITRFGKKNLLLSFLYLLFTF